MYTSRTALIQQREKTTYGSMIISFMRKVFDICRIVYRFIRSHKNMMTVMVPIAIAAVSMLLYFLFLWFQLSQQFRQHPEKLFSIDSYGTHTTAGLETNYQTIQEFIQAVQQSRDDVVRYKEYIQILHAPYYNFLQNIRLPSLFIREDPYTNMIDTDIVGRRFLQENPFIDTALIQYWSDFFRNV